MHDVGTHDDKAAAAAGAEKAVEPVEAEAEKGKVTGSGGGNATATAAKPVARPATSSAKTPRREKEGPGKGETALSAVAFAVGRIRNQIASLVWLVAVLAAAVLALGALFTALDQANQSNEIVAWVVARGHELVGPFKDLFRLETAKNTLLVNWGIAALVYLIAGKIVERFVRP
jgi:hypothetical protein